MSQPARSKHRRRTRSARPIWRTIRVTAILAFLCLAVLAIGFALAESVPSSLGKNSQASATCQPTLITPPGQTQPEKWYSINSGSAADILSAVKCTDMYQSALQGDDLIASALQTGTLASPWLVKPYRSDAHLSQFWVVPVVAANNHPLALLTFLYNPQSQLIQAGEFDAVTGDMFYVNHSFPAVTANSAVAAVSREQRVAAIQGRAPELIYFPLDHLAVVNGKATWTAGGASVIDPIWRVPGVDGKWHFVDHDGHTHLSTDFPVDPGYQPMPSTTSTQ
jgi:hypothetical protein